MTEKGIADASAVADLLRSPSERQVVRERATKALADVSPPDLPLDSQVVLAGGDLDLSGRIRCAHWDCRMGDATVLITRGALYFDHAIVDPAPADLYSTTRWETEQDEVLARLSHDVALLLQLRAIGADDFLTFRTKPAAAGAPWESDAAEAGIPNQEELRRRLIDTSHAEPVLVGEDERSVTYRVFRPLLADEAVVKFDRRVLEGGAEVKARVVEGLIAQTGGDVQVATAWGLPLASDLRGEMIRAQTDRAGHAEIVWELRLPVLSQADPSRILRLRRDDPTSLASLRLHLRAAVREHLAARTADASGIADDLRRDLEDGVRVLDGRMRAAEASLRSKHRLDTGILIVATTCGLLGAYTLAAGLVTAGVGSAALAEGVYSDAQRAATLDDLFMLWNVGQRRRRFGRRR